MKMKKSRNNFSELSIIGITAFFLGCFFLLIIFGTGIYSDIVDSQSTNIYVRSLSSYLLTVSKMSESKIIYEDNSEVGQMLLIEDEDTGYGNRIYLYDGYLVEDYGQIGGKLFPKNAIKIAKNNTFDIEKISERLLKITTDSGDVYISVKINGEDMS